MELLGAGLRSAFAGRELAPFRPRVPWLGGDLQTLRNSFASPPAVLQPDERLLAPIDVGAINLAMNYPEEALNNGRVLLLVHGLGGSEASSYMFNAARAFVGAGYTVARMNYRGVGPSARTSEPPYSAGLTSDLRAALRWLRRKMPDSALYLMGFSLGGQLGLRMLGEGDVPEGLVACVTVSAPLDLATSQKKLERPRNALYSRYVVNNMRNDLKGLSHPKVTVNPVTVSSVLAFDEQVIAPVFGFRDAADYYARVSCMPLLNRIEVPSLAIHAADDPWIPAEDYRQARWPDDAAAGALITASGGHVGFHGRSSKEPWYQSAARDFFDMIGLS